EAIAELVALGLSHRFYAGGREPGVVATDARPPRGPQQVTQRAVAQEVDRLVGQLELGLPRGVTGVALPRLLGLAGILAHGPDVAVVRQALGQALHGTAELRVHPVLGVHGLPDHL